MFTRRSPTSVGISEPAGDAAPKTREMSEERDGHVSAGIVSGEETPRTLSGGYTGDLGIFLRHGRVESGHSHITLSNMDFCRPGQTRSCRILVPCAIIAEHLNE